jgi:hypothetical protein
MNMAASTTTVPGVPTVDTALEAYRWYLLRLNAMPLSRQ